MFNEKSIKVPVRTFPSHIVASDTLYFIPEEYFNLSGQNEFDDKSVALQKNDELLVLQHGVGQEGKWCKVSLQNKRVGYVLFKKNLQPKDVPPFYALNTEEKYLPSQSSPQINWKQQKPNVAYEDAYNGTIAVHYELENVVQIADENSLVNRMEEARVNGLKIILDHVGYKYTPETLQKLLNDYYLYCTAEDWFFDARPCSTLRVAVVVPLRYLYAETKEIKLESTTGAADSTPQPPAPTPPQEKIITFKDYEQYKLFFTRLVDTLGRHNLHYITKPWIISPQDIGEIDFFSEIQQIKSFVKSTNELIAKNQPKQVKLPPQFQVFPLIPEDITWNNSLDIVIDKNALEIKAIRFYLKDILGNTVRFSLNSGYAAYLRLNEVINKTTINYILNFDPEKDFYDPFASAVGAVAQSTQNVGNAQSALDAITKAADVLGASLKGLSGGQADEDLKKFLTSKHYPEVTDIEPFPLDLVSCTTDAITRVEQLVSVRAPEEIRRWQRIKGAYENKKGKIEGDLFLKNLRNTIPENISDPNLRILFGIDKLDGKSDKEKLITYLTIANTIDWGKFLGVAAQCLMQPIPPEAIILLMNKYKEARKFIEQIFSITLCNPYLKNGLKLINGLQLPEIEVYNTSEVLAKELEAALFRILTDLTSASIKKLLEAAAKACAGNPRQNFNNGALPNPFENNANQQGTDAAINDILDDFYRSLGNDPNTASPISRADAQVILKDIIADISSCLSLNEACALYGGRTVNDEVYQLIISLVKRKYGKPYSQAFATREQIFRFYKSLGNNLDLTLCDDLQNDLPYLENPNLLCDDGQVAELRKKILQDHGLTPDLINQALDSIRQDEIKALEDVLAVLNSPNPFDFSKAPDLACKIFPNQVSVAPSNVSFAKTTNAILKSIYDTFDSEASEWFRTTYSIKNTSAPNFLLFNKQTGEIEVNPNVKIDDNVGKSIRANSGKEDRATQEQNSTLEGTKEVKLPAYMFREAFKSNVIDIGSKKLELNKNYIYYTGSLDGNVQQNLDINFIESTLKTNIQNGEIQLTNFVSNLVALLNAKIVGQIIKVANYTAQAGISLTELNTSIKDGTFTQSTDAQVYQAAKALISQLGPINYILYLIDVYLRSNPVDADSTKFALKDLYNYLDFTKVQESNGFFAAENGTAALYLVLGKVLFEANTWESIKTLFSVDDNDAGRVLTGQNVVQNSTFDQTVSLKDSYDEAKATYDGIKNYYRGIFKLKLNYPDFDINYQTGLTKVNYLSAGELISVNSYNSNSLYDIQSLEILRNKKNFIKSTELTKVNDEIVSFLTGALNINLSDNLDKPNMYYKYLQSKFNKYGKGKNGEVQGQIVVSNLSSQLVRPPTTTTSLLGTPTTSSEILQPIPQAHLSLSEKVYSYIQSSIFTTENKFIHLKDLNSPFITSIAQSGSGQPYTQYLKLVIKQTPQQKLCNVRPHYLDIDSIKSQIVNERADNFCVETTADKRTVGDTPISTNELENIERSATQDAMLRGMYRLAIRVFLHDILLRGIGIFGVYDPQSLRDEPAFISFMAKMTESEMRGIDNNFFIMLTEFLLDTGKDKYPEITNREVKKSLLFRDVVKQELQLYVLPKLAKRISADTNNELLQNIPRDNAIRLKSIFNVIVDMGIISVEGNKVFINTGLEYLENNGNKIPASLTQKIYEAGANDDEQATINSFINEPDFDFLFKYIFPVTQPLNYFFMMNCLATSTRRQVVNAFMGTKRDVIQTCKIIQANGQNVAADPNDVQAAAIDPLDLIIGFLLKSLITTPIKILKGVAESTEPNIALTSTAFKLARTFVPKLPSFIIPAVSIPLGTIPTPITCPLPFINPLLATAYFATFGWYDEKPANELLEEAGKALEKALAQKVECKDIVNQDLFYLDKSPIEEGKYEVNKDVSLIAAQTSNFLQTTPEAIKSSGQALLENERLEVINDIYNKIANSDYQYLKLGQNNNPVTVTEKLSVYINEKALRSALIQQIDAEIIARETKLNTDEQGQIKGTFRLVREDKIPVIRSYLGVLALRPLKEETYPNYKTDLFDPNYNEALYYVKAGLVNMAMEDKQAAYNTAVADLPPTQAEAAKERAGAKTGNNSDLE